EFDERAGELRRNGDTKRLEPQPARVLGVLLERAGEVVTRTELQQRVWSGDTFVDFDRGLNYCIAQIRDALGDSASEPRFVETLPRRGYRFIATVANLPTLPIHPTLPTDPTHPTEPQSTLSSQRINVSAFSAISAVVLVVALIAVASTLIVRR